MQHQLLHRLKQKRIARARQRYAGQDLRRDARLPFDGHRTIAQVDRDQKAAANASRASAHKPDNMPATPGDAA